MHPGCSLPVPSAPYQPLPQRTRCFLERPHVRTYVHATGMALRAPHRRRQRRTIHMRTDNRIAPTAHDDSRGVSLPQRPELLPNRPSTGNGSDDYQSVKRTSEGATAATGGPYQPQCTQHPAHTGAVEPAPAPLALHARHLSNVSDQASLEGQSREADGSATAEASVLEGRIATLVQLLDDDGHPISSREEAARHELLPEWDRLGKLCVCRGVLPPMPRWLPQSMVAENFGSTEANSPRSSVLDLVCVEFADGYVSVLERAELNFLPLDEVGAR
jgi:hypothetical protein